MVQVGKSKLVVFCLIPLSKETLLQSTTTIPLDLWTSGANPGFQTGPSVAIATGAFTLYQPRPAAYEPQSVEKFPGRKKRQQEV